LRELPGQQRVLWIWETGLQLERAGLRIYLVECVLNAALLRKFRSVRQDQTQRRLKQRGIFLEREVARFGHLESYPDRIQRHDGGERLRRIGGNQAADRHQCIADQSADGRAYGGVFQIEFCRVKSGALCIRFSGGRRNLCRRGKTGLVDVGLVCPHGSFAGPQRGHRTVQLLLRRRFILDQRSQTVVILLSLDEIGLGRGQIRLR